MTRRSLRPTLPARGLAVPFGFALAIAAPVVAHADEPPTQPTAAATEQTAAPTTQSDPTAEKPARPAAQTAAPATTPTAPASAPTETASPAPDRAAHTPPTEPVVAPSEPAPSETPTANGTPDEASAPPTQDSNDSATTPAETPTPSDTVVPTEPEDDVPAPVSHETPEHPAATPVAPADTPPQLNHTTTGAPPKPGPDDTPSPSTPPTVDDAPDAVPVDPAATPSMPGTPTTSVTPRGEGAPLPAPHATSSDTDPSSVNSDSPSVPNAPSASETSVPEDPTHPAAEGAEAPDGSGAEADGPSTTPLEDVTAADSLWVDCSSTATTPASTPDVENGPDIPSVATPPGRSHGSIVPPSAPDVPVDVSADEAVVPQDDTPISTVPTGDEDLLRPVGVPSRPAATQRDPKVSTPAKRRPTTPPTPTEAAPAPATSPSPTAADSTGEPTTTPDAPVIPADPTPERPATQPPLPTPSRPTPPAASTAPATPPTTERPATPSTPTTGEHTPSPERPTIPARPAAPATPPRSTESVTSPAHTPAVSPPVQEIREPQPTWEPSPPTPSAGPVAHRAAPVDANGLAPQVFPLTPPSGGAWASGLVAPLGNFAYVQKAVHDRGRAASVIEMDLPGRSWDELTDKNPVFEQARATKGVFKWNVPLTMAGSSLPDVASGRHDRQWDEFSSVLAASPTTVTVRLTMPHDADPDTAKAAFRRVSQILTERSDRVQIEWVAPMGTTPEQALAAYPGSDVVTFIGLTAPLAGSWQTAVAGPGGLYDWADFAQKQGKQVSVLWSITKDSNAPWVKNMAAWVQVTATQKRLGQENVLITGDAAPEAVKVYRSMWRRS